MKNPPSDREDGEEEDDDEEEDEEEEGGEVEIEMTIPEKEESDEEAMMGRAKKMGVFK